MTTLKALLIGAAGTLVAGAATAADLPMMKAEPVEYVKVCSAYGVSFFYIPGTDTCIAMSGFIRADTGYQSPLTRATDAAYLRTVARLRFDARTKTEIGDLRSFIELQGEVNNFTAPGVPGNINQVIVRRAFLQFAGIEAGYDFSAFNFYDQYYANTVFAPYTGEQGRRNLLSYTYTQNGFFGRLSVEDAVAHRNGLANGVGVTANNSARGYGGEAMPDVVGVVGYDATKNGFGRVQAMAALHQIRPLNDNYETEYGFAVGAAAGVNLPFGSKGTYFAIEGEYADGAMRYLGVNSIATNFVANGFSPADAFATPSFDLQKNKGFSVEGEAGYAFNDKWLLIGFGSYGKIYAPDAAPGYDDLTTYVAGANINFTPVKGLIITAEGYYARRDLAQQSVNDINQVGGGLRIKRNF